MSLIHSSLLLGAGDAAAAVQIERSLRFNSADSASLSRASYAGSGTFSCWVKRCKLGTAQTIISGVAFNASDQLNSSTAVFRDPSAWMHVLVSTSGTYVNGTSVSSGSAITPGIIGSGCDLYLANIHFIDGQALTPSSFTEVSATTGQLIPKAYTGSYGTNGFQLKFADNSSNTATTLGKDTSGNGNNWTPNNFSVTAGAGNDSLVDTPTSYGTDTGVGGEVRGNYCTWNPLNAKGTLTNGNLDGATGTTDPRSLATTLGVSSGKWYAEITCSSTSADCSIGVSLSTFPVSSSSRNYSFGDGVAYYANGTKYVNGFNSSYGASYATNDVIGIAIDFDNNQITFYKNGSSQGAISKTLLGFYVISVTGGSSSVSETIILNAGQRPFAYTAPSGFKALCDTNLPAPVVAKPNTVMDVKTYTGNGSTQTISGLGFSPDLVWSKSRSSTYSHRLQDTVRGATKTIYSNSTSAEETQSQGLTAFTSDGFTIGSDPGNNDNNITYVAWCFDGGTSTVSNTQGSITSSLRASPSSGFSVVTYTTTGSAATIGHGLNVAPSLIITKQRNGTTAWYTYHTSIGAGNYLLLNSTAASAAGSSIWNNTAPTSTVFSVGNGFGNGETYVAYCFSPVVGYSSFGSYTGNGNADGPFVYTGFRPRWVMVKVSSASGYDWLLFDSARDTYNATQLNLRPDLSDAESSQSANPIDFLSNGFKLRGDSSGSVNPNQTLIYAAFAESPFQYSRAR